jgi:hypothetical protein
MKSICSQTHMFHRHHMDKQTKEKMMALALLWAVFAGALLIVVQSMF